jgi:hypothetical protein
MLASLLPGLRDLRTPLAVGYLWLIGLWMIIGEPVITTADDMPQGPFRAAYLIAGTLGASVVLAALSFAAYLVGTMATFKISWNVLQAFIYPPSRRNRPFRFLRQTLGYGKPVQQLRYELIVLTQEALRSPQRPPRPRIYLNGHFAVSLDALSAFLQTGSTDWSGLERYDLLNLSIILRRN